MANGLNPGNRPRRGVLGTLTAAAVLSLVVVVVGSTSTPARAAELERFSSCAELEAWGEAAVGGGSNGVDDALVAADSAETGVGIGSGVPVAAEAGRAATESSADGATGAAGSDGDATNVAVEGVDELDLVDRLPGDRVLVSSGSALSIVDLAGARVEATTPVPDGAQVTYDAGNQVAWVTGHAPDGRLTVTRIGVGEGRLEPQGSWSTPGRLVDARRVDGRLHVVAADDFRVVEPMPMPEPLPEPEPAPEPEPEPAPEPEPSVPTTMPTEPAPEPMPEPSEPTTSAPEPTTPPEPGPEAPAPTEPGTEPETGSTASGEGSAAAGGAPGSDGSRAATTAGAAALGTAAGEPDEVEGSTPTSGGAAPDDVTNDAPAGVPFAGGPVACDRVLHPVGQSAAVATLLVTLPASGPVEPTHASQVVGSGELVHVTPEAAYLATPLWDEAVPATSVHRFDLATLEHTGSGRVEGTLLNQFAMSDHGGHLRLALTHGGMGIGPMPMPVEDVAVDPAASPVIGPPAADEIDEDAVLNEVVVLDTAGELDVVGRTPRFGHPHETIHGIRFDGDVGYAVTFLQTDPFYVLDLADPTTPRVAGEVELPGFSAYLHPLSDAEVVGFGPDEDGRAEAKLFDVSDRTAPRLVATVPLGDESAVVHDHHAFVDLGDGRFAVPVTSWGAVDAVCPPGARCVEEIAPATTTGGVVVLEVAGGELRTERRHEVPLAEGATRVLPTPDGWAVLGYAQLTFLDGSGAVTSTLALG